MRYFSSKKFLAALIASAALIPAVAIADDGLFGDTSLQLNLNSPILHDAPVNNTPAPASVPAGPSQDDLKQASGVYDTLKQGKASDAKIDAALGALGVKRDDVDAYEKAQAAQQQAPQEQVHHYQAQFNKADTGLIRDFEVKKEGTDPDSSVAVYGRVFEDCLGTANGGAALYVHPILSKDQATLGISILDKGGLVRSCQDKHTQNGDECSDSTPCRDLPTTKVSLAGYGHVTVKLTYDDMNKNLANRTQFESISTPDIVHLTQDDMDAAQKAKDQAALEAQIDQLKGQFDSCQGSYRDLRLAKAAMLKLVGLDALPDEDVDAMKKKLEDADVKLHFAELGKIEKELDKAYDKVDYSDEDSVSALTDALDAARDSVSDWADANADLPKSADAAARVLRKIARMYAAEGNPAPDFDKAKATLKQAKNLDGVSKATKTAIALDMDAMDSGMVDTYAVALAKDPSNRAAYYGLQSAQAELLKSTQSQEATIQRTIDKSCKTAVSSACLKAQEEMDRVKSEYTTTVSRAQQDAVKVQTDCQNQVKAWQASRAQNPAAPAPACAGNQNGMQVSSVYDPSGYLGTKF